MKCMRYLNLFEKVTGVRTNNCFFYNNCIIFVVPKFLVSKSIGSKGKNVKKLGSILGKKIKIIASPKAEEDVERFISDIVKPVEFKSLEITPNEFIITASRQDKASLIGRNKIRLEELKKIIEEFFDKKLKIV